jgi:putative transposase
MNYTTRVLRLRLRDRHAGLLQELARDVNFVWNYCNELAGKVWAREQRFLSGHDFYPFTKGAGKTGLRLHSQTIQAIGDEYATRRKQARRIKLRWRVSHGSRRSLGWVPFKKSAIRYRNGHLHYCGLPLGLWDSHGLSQYELGAGNFSEDARGRWYVNLTVRIPSPEPSKAQASVRIDLGLKSFAALSSGEVVEAKQFYRDLEPRLAVSQRARKRARTRALHARIANRRNDFLHKLSRRLVNGHGAIFVGNVNAAGLARTRVAKSVFDAGWSAFRTVLQYKCDDAGAWFEEVNESYSTVTCSVCKKRTGPSGREGLRIKEWKCACGALHDRDVNAAQNILAAGHGRLAGGIPVL